MTEGGQGAKAAEEIAAPEPAAPEPAPPPPQPTVGWAPPPVAGGGIEVPGSPGVYFAGMWQRFAAYLVDSIVLAFIGGIIGAALSGIATGTGRSAVSALVGAAISAAYFIGLWRSSGHATLGQRLVGIHVGNAFNGATLSLDQAAVRWAVLGYPIGILTVIPSIAGLAGLALFALWIALFLTTLGSVTRQGWHDQAANSAVVRRPGASSSSTAAILIIVGALIIGILVFAIVGLALLGGQISDILSKAGASI